MRQQISQNSSTISYVYGLGFIGAAIYYITTASGFWTILFGVLKSIVWPAFIVYEAFKQLGI